MVGFKVMEGLREGASGTSLLLPLPERWMPTALIFGSFVELHSMAWPNASVS